MDRLMNAGSRLFAFDTDYLWNNPQDSTLPMAQWLNHDGVVWSATTPRLNAAQALSWSTPVLGQGNRLYTGLAGFAAVDTTNGEVLWELAIGMTATAPIILSDGTIVASSGVTGRIYFIKDLTSDAVAPLQAGWPQAFHDNYHSNNAAHPHRWDRAQPRPYDSVDTLVANLDDPCWNMASPGWDGATCLATGGSTDKPEPNPQEGGCAGCTTHGSAHHAGILMVLAMLWMGRVRKRSHLL